MNLPNSIPQRLLASALMMFLPYASALGQGQVIYTSDFSNEVDSAWSGEGKEKAKIIGGTGMAIMGEFYGEEISLNLDGLDEHAMVKISFDLAIVRSWDGDSPAYGPDRILLHLDWQRTLMDATFANRTDRQVYGEFSQSYPGVYPYEGNPPLSGVDGQSGPSRLGEIAGTEGQGIIYHVVYCVPHTTESLEFTFQGMPTEPETEQQIATNESWGIANVEVATLAHPPVEIDQERFTELWQRLSSPDAVNAHAALWELASAGESICEFAADVPPISGSTDEALLARIERLILELDHDSYQVRENASSELSTISSMEVLPIIQATLQQDISAEVQVRLERLQTLHSQEGDLRSVYHSRLRHLLHVIGGEQAESLRAKISEPVPAVPAVGSPAESPSEPHPEWGWRLRDGAFPIPTPLERSRS